jgi:hypothetical protein
MDFDKRNPRKIEGSEIAQLIKKHCDKYNKEAQQRALDFAYALSNARVRTT